MVDLNKISLFRMTHIANVPHILVHGITHRTSAHTNSNFTPIGDPSLISTRNDFVLNNGRTLGDYVPFYFGLRMPMLYVIQKGYNGVPVTHAQKIVYCKTSLQKVVDTKLKYIYTDGHAIDSLSTQYEPPDVINIEEQVDFKAVNVTNWNSPTDLDLKRKMQAEFLLLGALPIEAILSFIVQNKTAKTRLSKLGVAENQIQVKTNAYFKP